MNYYNEFDPKAAAWLRELITEGLIPEGYVDTRSIRDVRPSDLDGYTQCHFFAGIGGWSRALQLAGWEPSRPVWTGSCPCQPFSCAGKGLAQADERHLWPEFFQLIKECRPNFVFGEQVAGAIGHGWLDGICADLEAENYACGAVVLGAHSVGAPHIRQRLYWVADAISKRNGDSGRSATEQAAPGMQASGLANATLRRIGQPAQDIRQAEPIRRSDCSRLADSQLRRPEQCDSCQRTIQQPDQNRRFGDLQQPGLGGHTGNGHNGYQPGRDGANAPGSTAEAGPLGRRLADAAQFGNCQLSGREPRQGREREMQAGGRCVPNFWSSAIWHPCRDGKARRISAEPALFPLANGLPGRVGLLRGAGNAICPKTAQAFIEAVIYTQTT